MIWPNHDRWLALAEGGTFTLDDHRCTTTVFDCGDLVMPTGRLFVCDPFVTLTRTDYPFIAVPPGRYPVRVTLADVSEAGDGSHIREAYVSLLLGPGAEAERRVLTQLREGEVRPPLEPGTFYGVPVDAGTICFVDGGAVERGMPAEDDWYESLFDDGTEYSWFAQMDAPQHLRAGLANIPLPLASNGENIIIAHSGWGDGHYPLVGGYDAEGTLVAVHLDLLVVPGGDDTA